MINLSDKSNEDDERKKAREEREKREKRERQRDRETERDRQRETDRERESERETERDATSIFEEGIESSRCISTLYICLQNLEKKVNEIFERSSSTEETQIKGARHMEEVN